MPKDMRWLISPTALSALLLVLLVASACQSSSEAAQHLSSGCADRRRLALTFDDGPNPPSTERIVSLLAEASVRAMFFDESEAVQGHPEIAWSGPAASIGMGSHSFSNSNHPGSAPGQVFAN